MGARYNAIAGRSIERLAALSDGLFAVAMTLLVLDLKVPGGQGIDTDHALLAAVAQLAPRMLAAQTLYAVGACLCLFSTYWSIGFIILVQLNYVIGPRIGILSRI